jgi:hypothetical protein
MKKRLCILFCVLILAVGLSAPALATEPAEPSEELLAMGLVKGSDRGLELERAPSRVEAAVMMVRLLGKEEEALSGTYDHPYEDVDGWADAYIGYLYEKGLVQGLTQTRFGSDALCTAQMYATFVLRALGYSDLNREDFSYENALAFGAELGFLDRSLDYAQFTRGDMMSLSCAALYTRPKDVGYRTLLEQLAADDGSLQEAAGPYIAYNALRSELKEALGAIKEAESADSQVGMRYQMNQGLTIMTMEYDISLREIMNGEQPQMAMTQEIRLKTDMADAALNLDIAMTIEAYYLDGFLYMNENGEKTKVPLQLDVYAQELSDLFENNSILPFYFTGEIEKQQVGADTLYTVSIPIEDASLFPYELLYIEPERAPLNEQNALYVTYRYLVDPYGRARKMTAQATAAVQEEIEGEVFTTSVTIDLMTDYNIPLTIVFPEDLTAYEAIEEAYELPDDLLSLF